MGASTTTATRWRTSCTRQTLLAYEMNGEPLKTLHGPPLRLRVENQLGFKMVKWIREIEFVESHKAFGEGEGGHTRGP